MMSVLTQFPATYDHARAQQFEAMFEGAAIGMAICQLDGRILEANPALSKMLGYSQQEFSSTHARELYPDFNFELQNKPNSNTTSPDQHFLVALMRGERTSFETEKRYRRKDGSELWAHLTVSLGRNALRQPSFLITTVADATERKQVEEHLREAEKMEVIGRLAGGIAHDFNNLLTGILLYCDLLSSGLENSAPKSTNLLTDLLPDLSQHVDEIRRAGEQGAALTQQLLAIARRQASEPRPISVNEIIASMENLLRRLIGEQIELVTAFNPHVGLALADPAQLRQVLLNLVLNARDAMPDGGKIALITRIKDKEFPALADAQGEQRVVAGVRRAVSLTVTDNGSGMTAETRSRLFEPFFTTKNPGQGTGLGLATVQRIVSDSGGVIEVESNAGAGTSIEVFLPAFESSLVEPAYIPTYINVVRAEPVSNNSDIKTSPKTILLVDDNAAARRSMERVLLDAGYSIFSASNGKQAESVFAEHADDIDLLIADCMMPGMNGPALSEILLRQKPELIVLLLSGFEDTPSSARTMELIRKPFSGKALVERVVEVFLRKTVRS